MKSQVLTHLIKRLRLLREEHGLTQEAFAELAGMSYKHLQAIEGGVKNDLRLSTLEKIADAYRIEVWQLFAPDFPKCSIAAKIKKVSRG